MSQLPGAAAVTSRRRRPAVASVTVNGMGTAPRSSRTSVDGAGEAQLDERAVALEARDVDVLGAGHAGQALLERAERGDVGEGAGVQDDRALERGVLVGRCGRRRRRGGGCGRGGERGAGRCRHGERRQRRAAGPASGRLAGGSTAGAAASGRAGRTRGGRAARRSGPGGGADRSAAGRRCRRSQRSAPTVGGARRRGRRCGPGPGCTPPPARGRCDAAARGSAAARRPGRRACPGAHAPGRSARRRPVRTPARAAGLGSGGDAGGRLAGSGAASEPVDARGGGPGGGVELLLELAQLALKLAKGRGDVSAPSLIWSPCRHQTCVPAALPPRRRWKAHPTNGAGWHFVQQPRSFLHVSRQIGAFAQRRTPARAPASASSLPPERTGSAGAAVRRSS